MYCMRCGRELENDQTFCHDCLADMEKCPVPPGTPVHLPNRREQNGLRSAMPRRRKLTPEEQIRVLKKHIRNLIIALVVTVALLLAALHPTVQYFRRSYYLRPGQNYSTIVTPTENRGSDIR